MSADSFAPRQCRANGLTLVVAALAVAAMAGAGCHAIFGPSKGDDNWREHDGERLSLFVRPNSFAESIVPRLTTVLEDQYAYTTAALAPSYSGRIHVYLYNSAADAGLPAERSGTAYALTEAVRVVCTPPFDDDLVALVTHELNHVVIIDGLGRAGTSFMTEGLASAEISEHYAAVGRSFLYSWTRSHRASLPHIATLMADDGWPHGDQNTAYNASASFLAYLQETYGAPSIRAIYSARSSELATRIAEVYGKPLETLEEEWLRFCASWTGT